MENMHGHCVCGAVEIVVKQYGDFVYTCHCDTCRRMNSGPVLSIDPGPNENVAFPRGEETITIYHDQEVQRGFCAVCGTTLYWHNPADNHYCMNAELFDDVIQNASFNLELFYDMKPTYYAFAGRAKETRPQLSGDSVTFVRFALNTPRDSQAAGLAFRPPTPAG